MKPKVSVEKAFSLVEVVMALGVISFAMVGMLGLLSVGLGASKKSIRENNASAMSAQLISYLRTSTASAYVASSMKNASFSAYFDQNGQLQMSATGSGVLLSATNIYTAYQCEVLTKTAGTTLVPDGRFGFMTMTFSWPTAITTKSRRTQEVIYASIPK